MQVMHVQHTRIGIQQFLNRDGFISCYEFKGPKSGGGKDEIPAQRHTSMFSFCQFFAAN